MDLTEKNPFSLYDFLGYAFPGALMLYLISKTCDILFDGLPLDELLINVDNCCPISEFIFNFCSLSLFVILSYVMGHIVSYLSSITLEKLTIWYYGFPSTFLLLPKTKRYRTRFFNGTIVENVRRKKTTANKRGFKNEEDMHFLCKECENIWEVLKGCAYLCCCKKPRDLKYAYIYRFLMSFLMLPWTVFTVLGGRILNLDNYLARPLDGVLVRIIKKRRSQLENLLKTEDKDEPYDFLRVAQHYVYGKNEARNTKLDNYVALYGFLRCISFIFISLFWICSIMLIASFWCKKLMIKKCVYVILIVLSAILSYICYMGFMKFYRRYAIEVYMDLVVDEDLNKRGTIQNVSFTTNKNEENHFTVVNISK